MYASRACRESEHYTAAAELYDSHVFYDVEGPLVHWQLETVEAKLGLRAGDRLADIGGGTGGFTHGIARRLAAEGAIAPLVTLVEPSAEMLAKAKARGEPELRLVHAGALEFLESDIACEKVLLKEVIHHLSPEQRSRFFAGLLERLPPGGQVLIVTRPQRPAYPFPEIASRLWAEGQAHHEVYEGELRQAGFEVEASLEAFPMRVAKTTWYGMLRSRFWSHLAHVTDAELEAGIAELEARHPGIEELAFDEVEVFLLGKRPRVS